MNHQIYKHKPQSPYQSDKGSQMFNPHEVLEPKSPVSQVDLSYPLLILSFDYCSNISPGSSSMVALIKPMCFSAFVDCSLFLMILSSGGNPFLQEPVHAWEFCFVDFTHLFGQLSMCLWLTGALLVSSFKLLIWFSFSYLMYESQLFLCCWPGQFSHRTENPSDTHINMTLFVVFSRLLTKPHYYFQFYVFLVYNYDSFLHMFNKCSLSTSYMTDYMSRSRDSEWESFCSQGIYIQLGNTKNLQINR